MLSQAYQLGPRLSPGASMISAPRPVRVVQSRPVQTTVITAKNCTSSYVQDGGALALVDWARQFGIKCDKLAPANFHGLRGLMATLDIKPDELILSVPRSSAFVLGPTPRCPVPDSLDADFWAASPWFVKLALLLVFEKQRGAGSRFAAYLSQLPDRVDAPVNWREEKLQHLQYPYLIHKVKEQQQEWEELYAALTRAMKGVFVSKADFFWGLSIVRSRTFSGPYIGSTGQDRVQLAGLVAALATCNIAFGLADWQTTLSAAVAVFTFNVLYEVILSQSVKQHVLCPMIDFMNHSNAVKCEVSYDYFSDSYTVAAGKDYSYGQQVFVSYGNKSNDVLMQYYGFSEPDNVLDTYCMTNFLKWLDEVAVVTQDRLDSLNDAGLLSCLQEVVLNRDGFPSGTLQCLRFLLADDQSAAAGVNSFRAPAGAELERQIAHVLLHACKCELKALGTTLQEDKAMVEQSKPSSDADHAAVLFRLEKKKVLAGCVEKLQALA